MVPALVVDNDCDVVLGVVVVCYAVVGVGGVVVVYYVAVVVVCCCAEWVDGIADSVGSAVRYVVVYDDCITCCRCRGMLCCFHRRWL